MYGGMGVWMCDDINDMYKVERNVIDDVKRESGV